jgi:F-type H+-transporting ATPase subunit a
MISPLEQFGLKILYPIRVQLGIVNLDLSLTISLVFLVLACYFYYNIFCKGVDYIWYPNGIQCNREALFTFIYNIILQQTGRGGLRYFPLIFTLFSFIVSMNFIGLLPLSFTNTSQIIMTATLSFSVIVGIILLGVHLKSLKFFEIFIPSNVPGILLPFLVLIEIVSFSIRPLSLALRLCANMMAGHTLLNIIGSFFFALIFLSKLSGVIIWVLLIAVGILEICIAVLQAYVFVMLVCVYMNDAISMKGH